jgi:GDP-4-dehydro-6-deoxy-D-mannose reductase
MRILVTGATGFVGGHLVELLVAARGAEVHGLARKGAWPAELSHLNGRVQLHAVDLTDRARLQSVLGDLQPEQIYHLAGYAQSGQSFREPEAAWSGNLAATRALFDAIAALAAEVNTPRIVAVTSGMIYGANERPDVPCDESAPLRPTSPYATSKAAADLLAYQVTRWPGLDVVRVRPFNQIGPRQSLQFAVASFARQLARIERGEQPPRLEVGDLSALRDFTDVRDMADAYRRIMESGVRGEVYNAASGVAARIGAALEQLRAMCRCQVDVVVTADRLRPSDPSVLTGNSEKLRQLTGWRPKYSLRQTLQDTLDYWRGVTESRP